MHLLWFTPAAVAVLGAFALVPACLRAIREAHGWRRDVELLTELRPALVELRVSADEARRAAQALRHRS
jgi:hypothetical protein